MEGQALIKTKGEKAQPKSCPRHFCPRVSTLSWPQRCHFTLTKGPTALNHFIKIQRGREHSASHLFLDSLQVGSLHTGQKKKKKSSLAGLGDSSIHFFFLFFSSSDSILNLCLIFCFLQQEHSQEVRSSFYRKPLCLQLT